MECGHVFCSHCITAWIEERRYESGRDGRPNCPSCYAAVELPRRVTGWDTFFHGLYKLLPTEAQENRQEILQQRQDQHEHWEAEQVVQRAEQEEARQRRLEEERARAERQQRVGVGARMNADQENTFRDGAADSVARQNQNQENNWSRLPIQDAFQTLDMNDSVIQLHRVGSSNSSSPEASSRKGNSSHPSVSTTGNANNNEARGAEPLTNNNSNRRGAVSTATA